MRAAIRIIFSITVISAIAGCATQQRISEPDAAMAAGSGYSLEKLQRGHEVYTTQCARCHKPMKPTRFSKDDWHVVVPGMAWNAGISEADEDAVLKYIMAAR